MTFGVLAWGKVLTVATGSHGLNAAQAFNVLVVERGASRVLENVTELLGAYVTKGLEDNRQDALGIARITEILGVVGKARLAQAIDLGLLEDGVMGTDPHKFATILLGFGTRVLAVFAMHALARLGFRVL